MPKTAAMASLRRAVTVLAPAGRAPLRNWLQPRALDGLVPTHTGRTGNVTRVGALAVKVAHPLPQHLAALDAERSLLQTLQAPAHGIPVPRLFAWRNDGAALVRSYIAGPTLLDVLEGRARRRLDQDALWELLERARAFGQRHGVRLDVTPPNLVVTADGGMVLVDTGTRALPGPLDAAQSAAELPAALRAYLRWRDRAQQRGLVPVSLPPGGAFHVNVAVGPVAGARVLWADRVALEQVGLPTSDALLLRQFNLATHARRKTTHVMATRYQDSPTLDVRGARGDGRSVFVGVTHRGQQVMLKGAGRTPLAWVGHKYHQDGFVSFNRALWEASIAGELHRLGFPTPRVVALLSTGKTTVDNTRKRWPAAAAVRVAHTQFRLGHLRRWTGEPDALRVLLGTVGRSVVRADFDAGNPRHQLQLAQQFVHNLGFHAGRTNALNIQCFNPTLGNITVDGTFLDFSTVRFFRHDVPDFRYLNNHRTVATHRNTWRLFVRHLVEVFSLGGLWSPARAQRVLATLHHHYDRRFDLGYLEGLNAFSGFPSSALRRLSPARVQALAQATRALRLLRGPGEPVEFTFWKQRCAPPLVDLPGRMVDYLRELSHGETEPWRALLSDLAEGWTPAGEEAARAFHTQFVAAFPGASRRKAQPRRWHEVIRPAMEAESLARLCYLESTPQRHARWDLFMSTAHHLPPGAYGDTKAKTLARALGHVSLDGVDRTHRHTVVGLTPELAQAVVDTLRRALRKDLVGIIVHGSRVMTRAQVAARTGRRLRGKEGLVLREGGPSHAHSSDLDLKVLVRARLGAAQRDRLERVLGERLRALGAWFPLVAHVPPRLRLIPTTQRDARAAFDAYNGPQRRKLQGKPPIPRIQAVVLWDAAQPGVLWEPPR